MQHHEIEIMMDYGTHTIGKYDNLSSYDLLLKKVLKLERRTF